MVDITLFELHLDGAEFTANAPGSGAELGEETSESDEEDDSAGAPLGLFAVVSLVAVVVAALAAKKVRGGDDTDTASTDAESA